MIRKALRHRLEPLTLGIVFIAVSAASPAWAYLDPGTGSMILQLMLGGVAGAVVIGKLYFRKAAALLGFGRRRSRAEEQESAPAASRSVPD